MPGKLKVKIVAGRHLPVMDRASDLTDAFVEVCGEGREGGRERGVAPPLRAAGPRTCRRARAAEAPAGPRCRSPHPGGNGGTHRGRAGVSGAAAVRYAAAEDLPGTLPTGAAFSSPAPPRRVSCPRGLGRRAGGWASPGQGQVGECAPQRCCGGGGEHPEPVSAGVFLKQFLVCPMGVIFSWQPCKNLNGVLEIILLFFGLSWLKVVSEWLLLIWQPDRIHFGI